MPITGRSTAFQVDPHDICSDGTGHLFIADGSNKRVLIASQDGKLLRTLTRSPGKSWAIKWVHAHKKLLHLYEEVKTAKISVFKMSVWILDRMHHQITAAIKTTHQWVGLNAETTGCFVHAAQNSWWDYAPCFDHFWTTVMQFHDMHKLLAFPFTPNSNWKATNATMPDGMGQSGFRSLSSINFPCSSIGNSGCALRKLAINRVCWFAQPKLPDFRTSETRRRRKKRIFVAKPFYHTVHKHSEHAKRMLCYGNSHCLPCGALHTKRKPFVLESTRQHYGQAWALGQV